MAEAAASRTPTPSSGRAAGSGVPSPRAASTTTVRPKASAATPASIATVRRRRRRRQMFAWLAGWSYRRRWWALALWVLVLAGVTGAAQAVGGRYHNDFSLPGTESQQALDTLRERAPAQAGAAVRIVLQDPGGLAAPATRQRVEAMLATVRTLPHVADVRAPYADPTAVSR